MTIRDLHVEESVSINELKLPHAVHIAGNSKLRSIKVTNSSMNELSFCESSRIEEISFTSGTNIEFLDFQGDSSISKINILDNAQIQNIFSGEYSSIKDFTIDQNALINHIVFAGNTQLSILAIHKCQRVGFIRVEDQANAGKILIAGTSKVEALYVQNEAKLDSFNILDEAILNELSIAGRAQVGLFNLEGGQVKSLLSFENLITSNIVLALYQTILPPAIHFTSVRLDNLRFIDFRASSELFFSNVGPNDTNGIKALEFIRSQFNLKMIGNRTKDFDIVIFENSSFVSAFFASTNFPKHVQGSDKKTDLNYRYSSLKMDQDPVQAKLFFEQLKMIFEKQGNKTETLTYQALELDAHAKTLTWAAHFWEKVSLSFHGLTTFYGTRWEQGALVFIIASMILYAFTLLSTEFVHLVWPWQVSLSDFQTYTSHYFEFINPAHNLLTQNCH